VTSVLQALEPGTATDTPDLRLVCRACYGRLHGPQAAALDTQSLQTDAIKPTDGSGCPGCGGAVFEAERVVSKVRQGACYRVLACRNIKSEIMATIDFPPPSVAYQMSPFATYW
jgi:hypothetical protein